MAGLLKTSNPPHHRRSHKSRPTHYSRSCDTTRVPISRSGTSQKRKQSYLVSMKIFRNKTNFPACRKAYAEREQKRLTRFSSQNRGTGSKVSKLPGGWDIPLIKNTPYLYHTGTQTSNPAKQPKDPAQSNRNATFYFPCSRFSSLPL